MWKRIAVSLTCLMVTALCTTAALAADGLSGTQTNARITRADLAVAINEVCGLTGSGQNFSDLDSSDVCYSAVQALSAAGIVSGYEDGSFRPGNFVTRQEAAVMLDAAFDLSGGGAADYTDAGQIASWARTAVADLEGTGALSGSPDGTFTPTGYVTYGEVDAALAVLAQPEALSGLTTDDIVSIQPYSELSYYAVGVTRIDITYRDGVDLSGVDAGDYQIMDRGYLLPHFGYLPVSDAQVNGQTVTLTIDRDTTANRENALIYEGANATGSRTKNDIYGLNATFSWYRENDGDIVEAARAFQYRNNELVIWHTGETIEDAVYQSDITTGEYLADSKCAPTNIEYFTGVQMDSFTRDGQTHNYTVGGFMTLEELGIQIPSSSGIEGDYVMAYVAFPEGYDPNREYPLILSLPGNSAAMWDIMEDGEIIASNPYGATFFNGSAINWYDKDVDAIVVYVSHRYHSDFAPCVPDVTDLSVEGYNHAKDDMALIDYFIDHYGAKANHVVLTGDSRGTMAGSDLIQAYPGRISTFLCINGDWGSNGNSYTYEDYQSAAQYGTSVWCIDGEQDSTNIPTLGQARQAYAEAGFSQEEIADMLRHTDLATEYNYYWGETDHSATKFVYWYLMDELYYGPGHIENGQIIYDDTSITSYQSQGKLEDSGYNKAGYDYQVYTDTLIDWVMSPDRELETVAR